MGCKKGSCKFKWGVSFPPLNRWTSMQCNANSASATLNKWLKPNVPIGCVIHSFRHSMRDQLMAVECLSDIIDVIGSWTTNGAG